MAEKKTKKPTYTFSQDGKTVYIDFKRISDEEVKAVEIMAKARNLVVKPKREGKKGDKLTYDAMRKALANDKTSLDYLERLIAKKENYFRVKKWFKAQEEVLKAKAQATAKAQ